jgi:hypothetical protein
MPTQSVIQIVGRWVSRIAGAIFIALFLTELFFAFRLAGDPAYPVPSAGRTIPWNWGGTDHYITAEEHGLMNALWILWGSSFVVVAIGVYLERSHELVRRI